MIAEFKNDFIEYLLMDDDGQMPFLEEIGNKGRDVSVVIDGECGVVLAFADVHVDSRN